MDPIKNENKDEKLLSVITCEECERDDYDHEPCEDYRVERGPTAKDRQAGVVGIIDFRALIVVCGHGFPSETRLANSR